jgi:DNA-binding MarR family transcriptional regulator
MSKPKSPRPLSSAEYKALAEFRYQLRRFLRNMEEHAREIGHQPQQYQLLLAIKGLPRTESPTIGVLAERMQLNHNSTVELIDRCEKRGLLRRVKGIPDRRMVTLAITPDGEQLLRQQASSARHELQTVGPILAESIRRLVQNSKNRGG